MLPRNLLGAPLGRADREAYCSALVEFFGSERAVGQYFVTAIDRITNKSIGLLQADSIFAARALFQSERARFGWMSQAGLVVLLLAVGLLCSNLIATSAALDRESLNDQSILRHGLKLSTGRTVRFTVALYMSAISFALIVAQVLIGAIWGR
jgi:hypothetical protein